MPHYEQLDHERFAKHLSGDSWHTYARLLSRERLQDYYLGSSSSNVVTSCGTTPASPIDVTLSYEKVPGYRYYGNRTSSLE